MKKPKKIGGTKCLNCGEPLTIDTCYCPVCGQQNRPHKISFGELFYDFLTSFISLDSRFGRSFLPFLFRPGYLTIRFIAGKRVMYANPVRLYIVISIIFFFTINLQLNQDNNKINLGLRNPEAENPTSKPDSAKTNQIITLMDVENQDEDTTEAEWGGMMEKDWVRYQQLKKENLSTAQIMDALKVDEKGFWEEMIIRQYIKLDNSQYETISAYIVQNASWMMFLLLPLFALILKIAYWSKKDIYYNEHLIHSLHIHAFTFFLFTIASLIDLVWQVELTNAAFLVLMIYVFFSLKNVYQQSLRKTIFKYVLIGGLYVTLFLIALAVEIILSLMLF